LDDYDEAAVLTLAMTPEMTVFNIFRQAFSRKNRVDDEALKQMLKINEYPITVVLTENGLKKALKNMRTSSFIRRSDNLDLKEKTIVYGQMSQYLEDREQSPSR
jgi:hypothetical protein